MTLDTTTLKVGDQVGIARCTTWSTRNEGIYTVVKTDKVKVVVQRASDNYERTFSAKTGCEKGSSKYRSSFLESAVDQEQRAKKLAHERQVKDAWTRLSDAAEGKSVEKAEAALAELKALGVK